MTLIVIIAVLASLFIAVLASLLYTYGMSDNTRLNVELSESMTHEIKLLGEEISQQNFQLIELSKDVKILKFEISKHIDKDDIFMNEIIDNGITLPGVKMNKYNYKSYRNDELTKYNLFDKISNKCTLSSKYDEVTYGSFQGGVSLPKYFSYIHVYKSAGTYIQSLLKNSYSANYILPSSLRISHLTRSFNDHIRNNEFVFTYIRFDIINRFLSGLYELYKRKESIWWHLDKESLEYFHNSLLESSSFNETKLFMLNNIIDLLYDDTCDRYNIEQGRPRSRGRLNDNVTYDKNYHIFNMHLMPQYYYLLDDKNQFIDEINFIGDTKKIDETLRLILKPWLNVTTLHQYYNNNYGYVYRDGDDANTSSSDSDKYDIKHYIETMWNDDTILNNLNKQPRSNSRIDDKHDEKDKFIFQTDVLTDEQISKLCFIYWLDFLCLPVEIPTQCDKNELITKFRDFVRVK